MTNEKIWRGILAAGLVALVTGCPAAATTASPNFGLYKEPTAATPAPMIASGLLGGLESDPTASYFPFERFFSWTYAVTIVSGGATTSAEDTYRIETMSTGSLPRSGKLSIKRTIDGTLVFDGEGSLSVSSTEVSIAREGAPETIKLPLKAGNDWESGTMTARSFKVDALTAGGTAYQDLIGIAYSRDGEVVAVRYLAPRYGIVKQVTRGKADGQVVETTSELTSSKTVAVSRMILSPSATISLTLGATATAEVTGVVAMAEEGLFSQDLQFKSSNTLVATVAKGASTASGLKGLVTAISTGTATLSAVSDQDPTKLATLSIEVN